MTTLSASRWVDRDAPQTVARSLASRACRVRLGPCDIRVRGAHAQAITDFAHLYADRLIDQPQSAPTIDLAITRTPASTRLRVRYRIASRDEVIFDNLRFGEVLPYLEWAVNYRFIMDCSRFVLVHAATVAWNGRGVALVGASGSGKSTLAAALVARGAQYLCDEFAVIDPIALRLAPFPRALCVKSGSFAIMRRLGLPLWRRRCHVKAFKGRVGYVRSCHLNAPADSVPLDAVIFPSFTGGEPRLHAMPRSQVAFSVAAGVLNGQHHAGTAAEVAGRVAARAGGYALTVGSIDATTDRVIAFLEAGVAGTISRFPA